MEDSIGSDMKKKDTSYVIWNDADLQCIRKNYAKQGPTKIGAALARSGQSVYNQARKMGLRFRGGKEQDTEFIRNNIETLGTTATAEKIGRSTDYVRNITNSLGLVAAGRKTQPDPIGLTCEIEKMAISRRWIETER